MRMVTKAEYAAVAFFQHRQAEPLLGCAVARAISGSFSGRLAFFLRLCSGIQGKGMLS